MKISTTEVHKLLYGDGDGDTVITYILLRLNWLASQRMQI